MHVTPLLLSKPLRSLMERYNKKVYLKLDCLQQSGSFKDRGMAHLCHHVYFTKNIRKLISSSGGNARLAVETVAQQLQDMEVHVIVPKTTKSNVVETLKQLNAKVTVFGENWNEADTLAREMVQDQKDTTAYVSPYNDPMLWEGHATVVSEIQQQLLLVEQSNGVFHWSQNVKVKLGESNLPGARNISDKQLVLIG